MAQQPAVPPPETPELDPDERAARLAHLADRLVNPDGLDRETLADIEAPPKHD